VPSAASLILVVDDDVTIRSMAEHYLGSAGFEVMTLDAGGAVVDTFLSHRPDAVLLDVILPDVDGFSVCRALRELPEARHLPIAMLTSLDDEEAIRTAFEAGATEFIPKPLNWLHETYRLRYLLRGAAILRDLDAARQEVARGAREWKQTFDAIDDVVLVLEPDLTIVRANAAAARLGQRPVDELVGMRCDDVFQRFEGEANTCLAEAVEASMQPERGDLRGVGPDRRDCLVAASPVLDDHGRLARIVYTMKDVTDYRRLQRELLQAQKMEALGVLAAGVAHDFNNLLQGIMTTAELLAARGPLADDVRDGLQEIDRLAERGRALTGRLLLTSRKGQASHVPVAAGPLLHEAIELLSRTIPKSITTEIEVPADLWAVTGDWAYLHQAVINLAINAVQAMPDGGVLGVRADNVVLDDDDRVTDPECSVGPHVCIAVSDTGHGMDPSTVDKMYEPFFSTKGPDEGTGLGLSIVYGIVRDHGGHIRCRSTPGAGTTFELLVPADPGGADGDRLTESEAGPPPVADRERTVLLVDDDRALQQVLADALNHLGYRVVAVDNGRDAIERYQCSGAQLDVILLDINMPEMDGESCLKELASRGCCTPILVMTGSPLDEERQRSLLRDAAGVLMKPFDINTLLRRLTQVVTSAPGVPP
jgi:DNA-binding response OmpR family regulator/nitrogen-specific signal transduction histidine kinase